VTTAENGADQADAGVYADPTIAETLRIEQRLRAMGYAVLPDVLGLGGDFDFPSTSVESILDEASRLLLHQQTVDLAGARILATLGELAVKAQAFDAIAAVVRRTRGL
jgi:hypothetical protein